MIIMEKNFHKVQTVIGIPVRIAHIDEMRIEILFKGLRISLITSKGLEFHYYVPEMEKIKGASTGSW